MNISNNKGRTWERGWKRQGSWLRGKAFRAREAIKSCNLERGWMTTSCILYSPTNPQIYGTPWCCICNSDHYRTNSNQMVLGNLDIVHKAETKKDLAHYYHNFFSRWLMATSKVIQFQLLRISFHLSQFLLTTYDKIIYILVYYYIMFNKKPIYYYTLF
jgi:hypothetical protein